MSLVVVPCSAGDGQGKSTEIRSVSLPNAPQTIIIEDMEKAKTTEKQVFCDDAMESDKEIFRGISNEISKNPERYRPAGQWLDGYCQNVIKKAKQHRKNLPQIISEKQKEAKRIKGLHGKTRKEISKLKDKSEINEQEEEKLSGLVAKANQLSLKVYDLKRELEHLKGKSQDEPGFIQLMSKAFEKASCEYPRNHIKIMVIVWLLTDEYLHKSKIGITKYEQYVFKHEIIEPEGTGLKRTISEQELARDAVLYAEPEAMKIVRDAWAHFQENEKPAGTGQKSKPAEEPSEEAKNVFKKDEDFWQVRFQGETKHISDCAGFPYIRLLLSQQGKTFTTAEFLSLYNDKPVTLASGDNQLDDEGKENYKKSLADIECRLQEAKNNNDFGTQEKLEKEKADIMATLTKAAGFGKHGKKLNSEFDKYRLSAGNAIVRAIDKIEKHIPVLAEHLRDAIPNPHSGTSLSYRPSKQINWML